MPKKILLVEDDVYLADIYITKLKNAGFEVITAENGNASLEKARAEKPDFVLLDILLPGGISGLDVLKILKADPETSKIPVSMLSNLKDENIVSEGFSLGAVSYFVKSKVTAEEVIKSINEFLKK